MNMTGKQVDEKPLDARRDFAWQTINSPFGSCESWGKLIYVTPNKPRPLRGSRNWESDLLDSLFKLKNVELGYVSENYGNAEWIFTEDFSPEQKERLSNPKFGYWSGWDFLVLPTRFVDAYSSIDGSKIAETVYREDVLHLRDTYSDQADSGDTPGRTITAVFETLKLGKTVLVFGYSQDPSGFLPAAIAMLAEPGCHIAKLIYAVRGRYPLSELQIGYLAGYWDARETNRFSGGSYSGETETIL